MSWGPPPLCKQALRKSKFRVSKLRSTSLQIQNLKFLSFKFRVSKLKILRRFTNLKLRVFKLKFSSKKTNHKTAIFLFAWIIIRAIGRWEYRFDWFWKIIVGSKWNVSQVEFVLVVAFCLEYNLKCVPRPRKKRSTGLKSHLLVQFCLIATLTFLIECN